MNNKRFNDFMHAIDDELLEEAQIPMRRKHGRIYGGIAAAACFCVIAAGLLIWQPWNTPEAKEQMAKETEQVSSDIAEADISKETSGVSEETSDIPEDSGKNEVLEEMAKLGYDLPVPEDASEVNYALVDMGADHEMPMAQATYVQNERLYTCRALKTPQAEDISGINAAWEDSLSWQADSLQMNMYAADGQPSVVSWYADETGTQWCLSADTDTLSLLHTAAEVMETLGYDVAVAPDNAENILYNAFEMNGLIVAETVFTLDGVNYSYRMASTGVIEDPFADISGMEEEFENHKSSQLGWCSAEIYYNEGGSGKIIWFDIVPGLLYSLSMDGGASEGTLQDMADMLFEPAQGEVG